jgi:radical SAM superfamily enzyme YgiQ (UPF0313 family)
LKVIKSLGGNRILFLDDNPIAKPEAAKELFRAMIPLRLKWASQSTINIARDPELLDLAARSGCVSLSIGLESINEEVSTHQQGFNPGASKDLAAPATKEFKSLPAMVGLDGDTVDTFQRSLQFLIDSKVSFLKLFTPCPYPGTKYYDDMVQADRLLTDDWGRYDYGSALVRPANMSTGEMMDGFKYVYEGFYSTRAIAQRLFPPPTGNYLETLAYLVANLKVNRYLRANEDAGDDLLTEMASMLRERPGGGIVRCPRAAGAGTCSKRSVLYDDPPRPARAADDVPAILQRLAHRESALGDAANHPRLVAPLRRAGRAVGLSGRDLVVLPGGRRS